MIYRLGERRPEMENNFIAPNASVIGDVVLGDQVSVWFNAVLRGDNEPIVAGTESNVQDGAILHTDPGFPLEIGRGVTVGHMAMLHGCAVGDYSLIGINAVVLNGARIGRYCIIGAHALITEGKEIPDGSPIFPIQRDTTPPPHPDDRFWRKPPSFKLPGSDPLGARRFPGRGGNRPTAPPGAGNGVLRGYGR